MEHSIFVQAQRCLSVVDIAYAALEPNEAFQKGKVSLNGQSVGKFSDRNAFAAAMGGALILEPSGKPWIFLRKNDDEALIEVAVRGTQGYQEWLNNFGSLILKDLAVELAEWPIPNGPTIEVRKTWLTIYLAIREKALSAVSNLLSERPGYSIEISGHSLGSALATLLAADLVSHFGNTTHTLELITFASPRVGGDQLRNHLNSRNVGVRRFFVSGDGVPKVPMRGSLPSPNGTTKIDYLNHMGTEFPLFTATVARSPDGFLYKPRHGQKYFWSLHGLSTYLQALNVTYSASVHNFSISPDFEFTRVLLDVRTGDGWDAGTDDDVYSEVLGHGALLDYPWYNDFERTYADIYEFQLNKPHRIADFQRFPLSFETNGVDRWQLRSVTTYLGTAMSTFERTHRPGPAGGSNDYTMVDWVQLGTVEFGNQFLTRGNPALRSAWPIDMQEQLLLPQGPLRIESLATSDLKFLTVNFSDAEGTTVLLHDQVGIPEQPYPYQEWSIEYKPESYPGYLIKPNSPHDFVLDIRESVLGDGSSVVQFHRKNKGFANQIWIFLPIGEATYLIATALDPKFGLDVQGDGTIKIRELTGSASQRFRLVDVANRKSDPE